MVFSGTACDRALDQMCANCWPRGKIMQLAEKWDLWPAFTNRLIKLKSSGLENSSSLNLITKKVFSLKVCFWRFDL